MEPTLHLSESAEVDREGLVQHLGNGIYIITDAGEAYLDKQYDAEAGRYLDQDQTDGPDSLAGTESETENAGQRPPSCRFDGTPAGSAG